MAKNDGSGGYWKGGKWIEITWGKKISDGLKNQKAYAATCERCGKDYQSKKPSTSKYCSYECGKAAVYTDLEGVPKKAKILGANILGGRGKQKWVTEMVVDALGKPCPYCGVEITLENMGLDHKEAYRDNKARRYKANNKELRARMDRRENLHLVCRSCNSIKGALHHDQFVALLKHLDTDPDAKDIVLRRLKMSMAPFGHARK